MLGCHAVDPEEAFVPQRIVFYLWTGSDDGSSHSSPSGRWHTGPTVLPCDGTQYEMRRRPLRPVPVWPLLHL